MRNLLLLSCILGLTTLQNVHSIKTKSAIKNVSPNVIPESFHLRHKATQKIVSQCRDDVCLENGNPLVLSLSQPSEIISYAAAGYKSLCVVGQQGQCARHAWYVWHINDITDTTVPFDFAYLPEYKASSNAYVLHNPFDNYSYDLGYNAASDKVYIVKQGSVDAAEWEFIEAVASTTIVGPTATPTIAPVLASQYVGCYIDDESRDISSLYVHASSLAACQYKCWKKFFALQEGYACFCGDSYSTKVQYAKVADSECHGSVGSSMGAGWRNAVYRNALYVDATAAPSVTPVPSVFCDAGSFNNNGACTLCPAGSYQDQAGQDNCIKCDSVEDIGATFGRYCSAATTDAPTNAPTTDAPTVAPTIAVPVAASQYLGCFVDDATRDIAKTWTHVSTLEQCQTKCSGFNYFALQGGSACFCGNAYQTNPVYYQIIDSKCTGYNNGKDLWYGGNFKNAVYKNAAYNGPANVAVTAVPVAASQFLGCFVDDENRDIAKTYHNNVGSVAECQYRCSGFNYFALQAGFACLCGNAYQTAPVYVQVADSVCKGSNMGRDLNLWFGAPSKNAVYKNAAYNGPANIAVTAAPVAASQYLGCFTDDDTRDIAKTWTSVTTLEQCQTKCSGFNYFALQAGSSCLCGNAYQTAPVYYQVADSKCTSFNNGKDLWYGGGYKNAVYKNAAYNGPANVAVTAAPV